MDKGEIFRLKFVITKAIIMVGVWINVSELWMRHNAEFNLIKHPI